jgi:hypothetical protein
MTVSKNTFPPETEERDAFYSEEMSRAAVGRLFDDADDDTEEPPSVQSAYVSGFDRNPTKKRERADKNERFKPQAEEPLPQEEHEDEAPIEQRHRRRETATTRLLNSSSGMPVPQEEERPTREGRRRNPVPKPAVRVNVQQEEHTTEENLDTFRRRYNSEELFSPPRSTNRPVRPGQQRDVRRDRARTTEREADTVSPLRLIMAGSAIVILLIVSVLTFSLISANGRYRDASERIAYLELEVLAAVNQGELDNSGLRETVRTVEDQRDFYRNALSSAGINPHAPPPTVDDGTGPGPGQAATTQPPATAGYVLPLYHTVVRNNTLTSIARRYFGNTNQATINHIMAANGMSNDRINIGDVLSITPMN